MTRRLLLIGLAVAALLVPLPPALVERVYSSTIFPVIQALLTRASNATAIAWFDVFIGAAAAWLLALSARDLRMRRLSTAGWRILLRLTTVASAVYLLFLATWGLNYQRQPLREKVPYVASRITNDAALGLARETVAGLNATHDEAHRGGWPGPNAPSPELATSFSLTSGSLGLSPHVVPGRPKHSMFDLYFRRAGVAGMTDPFFLETLVASDLLPFERPMVAAHEWAHLAGITDEGEANFVGWLSCMRGAAPQRYSGWIFLYSEVMDALPGGRLRELNGTLQSGPRADLQAIRQRHDREVSPRLSRAGWQVYDQYLKANRVDAGTASYAEVVQLILGTNLR